VAPPDMNALVLQLAAQHACAHEGVLQVQLVDAAHERQVEPHRESRRPVGLSQTDLV
jgi:50S ribosomal subunit-associated GTPase HflX